MRLNPAMLVLPLLALGGCQREPDFEERYKDASAQISQSAREIDAQIAGTDAPSQASGEQ